MIRIIKASFRFLSEKFPASDDLRAYDFTAAVALYLLLQLILAVESVLIPFPSDMNVRTPSPLSVGIGFVAALATALIQAVILAWILNRFSSKKFTYKGTFIMMLIFSAATQILAVAAGPLLWLLGITGAWIVGLTYILIGLYVVFLSIIGIAKIAAISRWRALGALLLAGIVQGILFVVMTITSN